MNEGTKGVGGMTQVSETVQNIASTPNYQHLEPMKVFNSIATQIAEVWALISILFATEDVCVGPSLCQGSAECLHLRVQGPIISLPLTLQADKNLSMTDDSRSSRPGHCCF
jgi:hypothetical protein